MLYIKTKTADLIAELEKAELSREDKSRQPRGKCYQVIKLRIFKAILTDIVVLTIAAGPGFATELSRPTALHVQTEAAPVTGSSIGEYSLYRDMGEAGLNDSGAAASQLMLHDDSTLGRRTSTAAGENLAGNDAGLFTLSNCHPNPFNFSTQIEYVLGRSSRIQLIIYDTHGQEIKKLVDSYLPAGTYSATWNGEDDYGQSMPNGIYLYCLQCESSLTTKKVVLLK